jgi:aminoglycoside phosphotransferase (APT) family kinase protein
MPDDSHTTAIQSQPPNIDALLVHRLIAGQFPRWAGLPVRPVIFSGWDNRTFHLGEDLVVRLPRGSEYANQVTKEHRWLPELAPHLPLKIPEPIVIGAPLDTDTWTRARAWAFWKAAIVAAGLAETNAVDWSEPWRVIDEVLAAH